MRTRALWSLAIAAALVFAGCRGGQEEPAGAGAPPQKEESPPPAPDERRAALEDYSGQPPEFHADEDPSAEDAKLDSAAREPGPKDRRKSGKVKAPPETMRAMGVLKAAQEEKKQQEGAKPRAAGPAAAPRKESAAERAGGKGKLIRGRPSTQPPQAARARGSKVQTVVQ